MFEEASKRHPGGSEYVFCEPSVLLGEKKKEYFTLCHHTHLSKCASVYLREEGVVEIRAYSCESYSTR